MITVSYTHLGVIESIDELERKCRESLQGERLQRVKFSHGVVVVGEENASRVYLGDVWSTNSCPLIFCASGRWCSNKVVVPSAWVSRESVIGSYGGRYFERELCVDGEIELFKVDRNYKEFVERLGIERVENYIEILPCVEADIAAVDDDVVNDEFITYLVVTDYTKGDMTILYDDKLYDKIIWNNPVSIVEKYEKLNNHYVDDNNIRYRCV